MGDILGKLTFRFLISQLIPGLFIVVSGIAFRMLATRTGPITPSDIWISYSAAVESLVGAGALAIFFAAGAAIGLVLQGISSATEANLESFRKVIIDEKGNRLDLPPDKIRRRSLLRNIIATIWCDWPLGIILFISPFIAAFDIWSVAAAKPKYVYKTLHVFRNITTDSSEPTLGDYLYISTYFANTSIAILFVLIMQMILLLSHETAASILLLDLVIYLCLGLHYLLWRTIKTSLDCALVPLLSPKKFVECASTP